MFQFPTRTVALLGVTAATGLAVSGCGSGDHAGHASGAAGTTSTPTSGAPSASTVDRAFVTQMIPHHEMAVEMAADTGSRGQHPEIKALGASITNAQEREIVLMRAAAKRLGVTPASMPMGGTSHDASMGTAAKTLGIPTDGMGMSMDMTALKTANPYDRAFIDEMIPHHQGAIRMARAELARGGDPELERIATAIVAAQTKEITQMNAWRKAWYGATSPAGGVPAA